MLGNQVSITIIDGQNEDAINNITDNEYNPCLPMPITRDKRINITFSSNITSLRDWFPSICSNHNDSVTEYMFDGAQKWNFENLIVDDYDSGNGYALVRTVSFHSDINCNHCTFRNITNNGSLPLFESWGSLHFEQCDFVEIHMKSTNMMSADFTDCGDESGSECTWSSLDREYSFIDSTFTNLTLSGSLLYMSNGLHVESCSKLLHFTKITDFHLFSLQDDDHSLVVHGSSFENIECSNNGSCIMFNDVLDFCDVSMTSVSLKKCNFAFYAAAHTSISEISMSNMTVETSAHWSEDENAFLQFSDPDVVEFL